MFASVVKKQFMALSGLMMCGFLLIHLAGNLLIFQSAAAFNQYAFFMLSNPLIKAMEVLLGLLFLTHALMGLWLIHENVRARPKRYAVRGTRRKGSKLSFVSMSWTGPLMLIFLIAHLIHFRFGEEIMIVQGGVEMRDLFTTVAVYYQSPLNALLYSLAMVLVALHVQHGFWSAFQSFGFNHPRYNRVIEISADLYAVMVFVGFVVIPWYFVITGTGAPA